MISEGCPKSPLSVYFDRYWERFSDIWGGEPKYNRHFCMHYFHHWFYQRHHQVTVFECPQTIECCWHGNQFHFDYQVSEDGLSKKSQMIESITEISWWSPVMVELKVAEQMRYGKCFFLLISRHLGDFCSSMSDDSDMMMKKKFLILGISTHFRVSQFLERESMMHDTQNTNIRCWIAW